MKTIVIMYLSLIIISGCVPANKREKFHRYGNVQTEKEAVDIAASTLNEAYGKDHISREQPFLATLQDDVWYVHGALPPNTVGGVGEVTIKKSTGEIIQIWHGK